MKLWVLRPAKNLASNNDPWIPWYDCCDGFVVRAETADAARVMASGEQSGNETLFSKGGKTVNAWLLEEYTTCEELTAEGIPEIILRDFNAA